MRSRTDMIRLLRRRTAASHSRAGVPTPPASSFFAVGLLAIAAMAPTGLSPVPLPSLPATPPPVPSAPSAPGLASPVTVGAILKAVDKAGNPLATARFDVYRANQPDGEQHPVLDTPAVSGGVTTVPLPAPSSIPSASNNYFAVVSGLSTSGGPISGIEFFDLTTQNPLANVLITPNLFDVGGGIPSITIIGETPPVPTGPCGFQPDTEHPAPPAFRITTETMGVLPGTVRVGEAHGAGASRSPGHPEDLPHSEYEGIGEELSSEWSRDTESSTVMAIDTHGQTQTPYAVTGHLQFTLKGSDIANFSSAKSYADQSGEGATALVVPASWLHQKMHFECTKDGTTETHELWNPYNYEPSISTGTPPAPDSYMDSYLTFQSHPLSTTIAMAANQHRTFTASVTLAYVNGYGAGAGAGPVGVNFEVASQTAYGATHQIDIWSGDKCGTVTNPLCFAWHATDDAATPCIQWQMACGSDYYTMILPAPTTVPDPAVEPCSKYEPHGACS